MPKACPACGSRKWRKDGVTGNAICEDGHVFQDFRSENLVLEPTGVALQRRHVKKGPRVRKAKASDPNPDLYHGKDADWLKAQALQLMLRAQVSALTKLWSLPDAFEMIVRDLWAFNLERVHLPPSPGEANKVNNGDPDAEDLANNDQAPELDMNEDDDGSDNSDLDGSGDGIDLDLLEKMSQRSSSGSEMDDTEKTETAPVSRKKELFASSTLVCLVLGLWTIRYPFLNTDIELIVNRNQIPYIDFGRSSHIPEEMRKHINRTTMIALCPTRCLPPTTLHFLSRQTARYIQFRHSVHIPEINLPPVAWRVISSLGGTPTVYAQVIRILALLDANMSLQETELKVVKYRRKGFAGEAGARAGGGGGMIDHVRSTRRADVWLPEMSVAAAWIILVKMAHGFDGRERAPLLKTEPSIGMTRPDVLVAELSRRLENGTLNESNRELGQQDFVKMDLEELDRFMDRCEDVLLKDRPITSDPNFPLPPSSGPSTWTHQDPSTQWRDFHGSAPLLSHKTIPAETPDRDMPLLPGEEIPSFSSRDVSGTLPKAYDIILRAAAEVVGVRDRELARLVEMFERRIDKPPYRCRGSNTSERRSRAGSRAGSQGGSRPVSRAGSRSGSVVPSRTNSSGGLVRRKSTLMG